MSSLWSHVQDDPGGNGTTTGSGVSSLSIGAFGSANTVGNFIVVFLWGSRAGATVTVTDNGSPVSNKYQQVLFTNNNNSFFGIFIAQIANLPSVGNLNPKISFGGISTGNLTGCASEVSSGTVNLDGSVVTATGATQSASATFTSNDAGDLLLTGFTEGATTDSGFFSPAGGWNSVGLRTTGGGIGTVGQAMYQIPGVPIVVNPTWSPIGGGANVAWVVGMAGFFQPLPPYLGGGESAGGDSDSDGEF